MKIVMELLEYNSEYHGTYYYKEYKTSIFLQGKKEKNGKITLYVIDDKYSRNKTEYFIGTLKNDSFGGQWKNADASKVFPFSVKEDYTTSNKLLFYRLKDSINYNSTSPNRHLVKARYDNTTVKTIDPNQANSTQSFPKKENLQKLKQEKEAFFKEYLSAAYIEKKIAYIEEGDDNLYYYNWKSEKIPYVLFNKKGIISMLWESYEYKGEEHGMSVDWYSSEYTKTGKAIQLADIFPKNRLLLLKKRIFNQAKKQNVGLLSDYEEESNIDLTTENFLVHAKGLTFSYFSGSIATYAEGKIHITLTWYQLQDIIKEDSFVRLIFEN